MIADERLRPLSTAERNRYSRNILVPEVGAAGQRRIRAARVMLVGAGALGSPAALYLAAAGVGSLGIIDDDDVDVTNLQRQVLHTMPDVGLAKVESARRAVKDLNPDVEVVAHREADAFTLGAGTDIALGAIRPADGGELVLTGVRTSPPPLADEVFSILEPVQIAYEAKDAAWKVVASGARGGELLGGLRAAGIPDDVLAAVAEVA